MATLTGTNAQIKCFICHGFRQAYKLVLELLAVPCENGKWHLTYDPLKRMGQRWYVQTISALGTKVRGRGLTQGDSPLWSSTKSSGAVRL